MPEADGCVQEVLSMIVPEDIFCAAALLSAAQLPLFAVEERSIARAVPVRREEFRAGRSVARMALAKLGLPGMAIPQAPDRVPLWPGGVVGTIAHAGQFAVAMVARDSRYSAIGFDFEPTRDFDESISGLLLRPDEDSLKDIEFSGEVLARSLHAFVVKEAAYKAIYPLTRRVIDFLDARVSVFETSRSEAGISGCFAMEVLDAATSQVLPQGRVCGQWSFNGHFVGALAALGRQAGWAGGLRV